MRSYSAGVAALAVVFAAALPAQADQSVPSVNKWSPYIDLGGKVGNKRDIGEADLFLPLVQNDNSMLFADVRTRFDNDSGHEGNFGLGLRHMLGNGWNIGGYGYFDRRKSAYDNYFNQITLGAEALSLDWDLRANAYVPVGKRTHSVSGFNSATLSGTSVTLTGGEEKSLGGFDAEAGWRIPLFDANAGQQLRIYGGGYRFTANGVSDVTGPRARLEYTLDQMPELWPGARLSLGLEVQHDDPRGTQTFASLSLRVPLEVFTGHRDRPALTAQERRMLDPVVRDVDVVSEIGFTAPETVTAFADGTSFSVVNSASTSDLNAALASAGTNSTVLLAGTFNTTTATALQSGQTVIGGGSFSVRAPSGRTAVVTLPGATISAATTGADTVTNAGVLMADNSTLDGLTVNLTRSLGTGSIGVLLYNVNGVTVRNSTISASETGGNTAAALDVLNSINNTISNNTLTATTTAGNLAMGLGLLGGSGATVTGNTMSASGGGGGNDRYISLGGATVYSGSTGNIHGNGVCNVSVSTGTVYFTDGSHCP